MPLESLRAHLRRLFGGVIGDLPPEEPPSPINPDDLEITGVKESTNPSSTATITTTVTATATATAIATSTPTPTTKRATSPSTKEKEKEQAKGKDGEVSLECAICLGSMKKITATTCGHVFCYECIKTAIQITKCCPMCKKKLTLRSIHALYL